MTFLHSFNEGNFSKLEISPKADVIACLSSSDHLVRFVFPNGEATGYQKVVSSYPLKMLDERI